jgi:hypothetical protein
MLGVGIQQRSPVEQEPSGAQSHEDRQGEHEESQGQRGAAPEGPASPLGDVVSGARAVPDGQSQDRAQQHARDPHRDPQAQRGERRDASLVRREEIGRGRRQKPEGVDHPPVPRQKREPRDQSVGIAGVELERGVVRFLRPGQFAFLLGTPAEEDRGPREIGEPVHADFSPGAQHLFERLVGRGLVVLREGGQELEPLRPILASRHRRRKRRQRILRREASGQQPACGGQPHDGGRETQVEVHGCAAYRGGSRPGGRVAST